MCRHCKEFQKEVFDSEQFAKIADRDFELVQFGFPVKSNNKLLEKQLNHNEALTDKYNPDGSFFSLYISKYLLFLLKLCFQLLGKS